MLTKADMKQTEITQILTSLYYLSKESKSADLDQVSDLINKCIERITDWTQAEGKNLAPFIADEQTFEALEYLSTFANSKNN